MPCVEPDRRQGAVGQGGWAQVVFDGEVAVAWCQYGTPEELPGIYHRKEYEAGLERVPDYRLTASVL